MKVISIVNNKGGVGKTTLTANIGAQLAYEGYRVLIIDSDPQANLTMCFVDGNLYKSEIEMTKTSRNLYATYFDDKRLLDLESLIIKPPKVNEIVENRLDLICSNPKLNEIIDSFVFSNSKISKKNKKLVELEFLSILRKAIKTIKEQYDFIIIDCPPSIDKLTKNAIVASDYYFIPIKLDYLSMDGLSNLLTSTENIVSNYNNIASRDRFDKFDRIAPKFGGIISNMVNIRNNEPISGQQKYLQQIKYSYDTLTQWIRFYPTPFYSAPERDLPLVVDKSIRREYPELLNELINLVKAFKERVGYHES